MKNSKLLKDGHIHKIIVLKQIFNNKIIVSSSKNSTESNMEHSVKKRGIYAAKTRTQAKYEYMGVSEGKYEVQGKSEQPITSDGGSKQNMATLVWTNKWKFANILALVL